LLTVWKIDRDSNLNKEKGDRKTYEGMQQEVLADEVDWKGSNRDWRPNGSDTSSSNTRIYKNFLLADDQSPKVSKQHTESR